MEYQKELTLVLWGIALVGMFFLARGITGNVIGSYSISSYCLSDVECQDGKICCIVNSIGSCSDSGVCDELKNFAKEKPMTQKSYNFDIIFGLLVLMCVLIATYSAIRANKKIIRVKKAKRRR